MTTWFNCKVSFIRQHEDGTMKRVKEAYLIDAISFTDAEARVHEEVGQHLSEFIVESVTKMNVREVYRYTDSETWYKCKVVYLAFDEGKGKEKLITDLMFITATNLRQAYDRIVEKMGNIQLDYEVTEIVKSPIVEVYRYISPDERITPNLKPIS
jgi:hypothetical protein